MIILYTLDSCYIHFYLSELGKKTIWCLSPHISKNCLLANPRAREVIIVIKANTKGQ